MRTGFGGFLCQFIRGAHRAPALQVQHDHQLLVPVFTWRQAAKPASLIAVLSWFIQTYAAYGHSMLCKPSLPLHAAGV
jgi:hypothetical protein